MDEVNPKEIIKKKKFSKQTIFIILLILSLSLNILFILGIPGKITGYTVSQKTFKYITSEKEIQIDSNSNSKNAIIHYSGLKETLTADINQYTSINNVGFFLQDIKTGTWLGLNEKTGFAPASLLKIPIMMAILKKIDRGEMGFKDEITLKKEDLDYSWGTLYKEGAGAKLDVIDLLEEMILSSDNTAKNALKRQLTIGELSSVFSHVGIPNPYLTMNNQTVSPRDFIRLFRALYYSTYLSPELSEKALDLTTDSEEESLISKGVPTEVQVAHKFGEIIGEDIHDCGIVYYKPNPYFICIMTEKLDETQGKELIQRLSKDIFDYTKRKTENS